ncbi:MAG TPA: DUF1800 domain-containing protein, partial [Anaerolineae bacterium]|nr:DUF1800 domain-containing protein [Anaerolineae bacterium]
RITYGPTPVEIQRLATLGYDAFIEEQLNPESIDDSAADAQLVRFRVLTMGRRQLVKLEGYRLEIALQHGMVARAVHSRRQLFERMFEFWTDHFNVGMNDEAFELVNYHQQIRKHTLGRFSQLLAATAKHPAMLVYLDNFVNIAEHPNENYARELLELHTLGVDGGYTEEDIRQVARAFTGWTTHPRTHNGFYFDPEQHDSKVKKVLGHTLPAGRGIEDGYHVLNILANHPSTARFISTKLCRRFVADRPPATLVESTTKLFLQTQGDIKAILRHILLSAEFNQSTGQKLRRPLDMLIGSLRATQTEIDETWHLDEILQALDQKPFAWQPPNGYPDVAAAWASPNSMLARWNVAMLLTHGAHTGTDESWGMRSNLDGLIGQPKTVGELVDQVATRVFGEPLNSAQSQPFIKYASDGQGATRSVDNHLFSRKYASLFGLMLASPLYQWR